LESAQLLGLVVTSVSGLSRSGRWHVDEFKTSTYRLVSPLKAVQTIFLFSDVGPGDGATPIVRGSHRDVARMLAAVEPKGIEPGPDFQRRLEAMADSSRIVSFTGEAGDVVMMHPFLAHGFGTNTGTRIRFGCNPLFELVEPLRLERGDAGYSAVEQAVRIAIGLDR
jgi:ectoine hydroxylase-related dioxygenase (phytanoyl-CoA dioxygenase family)